MVVGNHEMSWFRQEP
jgi:hypothetical protein